MAVVSSWHTRRRPKKCLWGVSPSDAWRYDKLLCVAGGVAGGVGYGWRATIRRPKLIDNRKIKRKCTMRITTNVGVHKRTKARAPRKTRNRRHGATAIPRPAFRCAFTSGSGRSSTTTAVQFTKPKLAAVIARPSLGKETRALIGVGVRTPRSTVALHFIS